MRYQLHTAVMAAALSISSSSFGQTYVSTFDDISLSEENSTYITSMPAPGKYSFSSGLITFEGEQTPWGSFADFNVTNVVDTVTPGFPNDKSAITGKGFAGSDQYGIAYANQNWEEAPTESLPIGCTINGDDEGNIVAGMYVTNTTWVYHYIKDNYSEDDYLDLVIRGYLNEEQSGDSIVVNLGNGSTLLNSWEWLDLSGLGKVDSLSFQLFTTDDFTPFYFSFDNITVMGSGCATPLMLEVINVAGAEAVIGWNESLSGTGTNYQIAVDQSPTLAPVASVVEVSETTYTATVTLPHTQYYVHLRSICTDGTYSDWDTVSFTTSDITSTDDINFDSHTSVLSPNPAKDYLQIHAPQNLHINIYDWTGRCVMQARNVETLDVRELASGMYFVKGFDHRGRSVLNAKFVKN